MLKGVLTRENNSTYNVVTSFSKPQFLYFISELLSGDNERGEIETKHVWENYYGFGENYNNDGFGQIPGARLGKYNRFEKGFKDIEDNQELITQADTIDGTATTVTITKTKQKYQYTGFPYENNTHVTGIDCGGLVYMAMSYENDNPYTHKIVDWFGDDIPTLITKSKYNSIDSMTTLTIEEKNKIKNNYVIYNPNQDYYLLSINDTENIGQIYNDLIKIFSKIGNNENEPFVGFRYLFDIIGQDYDNKGNEIPSNREFDNLWYISKKSNDVNVIPENLDRIVPGDIFYYYDYHCPGQAFL